MGTHPDLLTYLVVLVVVAGAAVLVIRRAQEHAARENRERSEREAARASIRPPPNSDGTFTAFDLWPQATYRVVTAFVDYDDVSHGVGDRWRFLRKAFLPYEDGLSLFVDVDGQEVHIRMQCRDDAQGPIVNAFSNYVVEESAQGPAPISPPPEVEPPRLMPAVPRAAARPFVVFVLLAAACAAYTVGLLTVSLPPADDPDAANASALLMALVWIVPVLLCGAVQFRESRARAVTGSRLWVQVAAVAIGAPIAGVALALITIFALFGKQ
ncbi:MAG: DUF3601 domain-containing protein [Pseudomonadota bacterium]